MAVTSLLTPIPVSPSATLFSRTVIVVDMWLIALVVVRYRANEEMRQADVSARLEAETARRRSDKNFEDIRYALDQSAIVVMTNARGEITYVNDKFCELSGYGRQDLIGTNPRLLNSRTHGGEFFSGLYGSIAAGHVWRGEIRNRAKTGALYWVDTTIVPILDDHAEPHQYIAIQYDITERKRSEAALRDQEALAKLGRMAAVVAHEVRNPLAGIRGAMQIIARRLDGSSEEYAVVQEAVARIDTLNGIVQDLLLFARPNQPVLGPVVLDDVLRETARLFSQDPEVAGVGVQIDPSNLVVCADANQLKIVLLNLLINGAQAMAGHGTITITACTSAGSHEVRIADEGPGVSEEARDHLFEPFFTTRHRGTGLGLVTARRVLEAHHGSIALESAPAGHGTVAIVRLPAR